MPAQKKYTKITTKHETNNTINNLELNMIVEQIADCVVKKLIHHKNLNKIIDKISCHFI